MIAFAIGLVSTAADEIEFNRDVRPILSKNCFQCHGPSDHRDADLRLDTYEGATESAIVPGKPEASKFVERIMASDPGDIMPPPKSHKTLTDAEKSILAEWIRSGAEYQEHWSLLPVKSQPDQSIDDLVDRGQPRADERTLIRRVTLDLTGLPPTLDEIAAFLGDDSPDAYEKLVQQLLNSPRYGEHMAKYWLDLVRYGDSHGIHADNYREMFLYRDWVIRAFNANQPFDEFTIDQVAGDLRESPSTEQLIASGFNRLHISNSAGSALQAELYVNNVKDRVDAIGTVYLGLTVGCAACHDHKYDPISQKEYYQLFAFLNNLDGPPDNKGHKSPVPLLAVPTAEQSAAAGEFRQKIAAQDSKELREQLKKLESQFPTTLVMKERAQPRPAHVLIRGEYDNPGEEVERGTPAVLPPMNPDSPRDRMGLAQWIVDPDHPLTARVAVNRFWQQLFGVGLVKTSEDLGSQGEWPSHPDLLDFLAHEFVASGWDVKALMKSMVMSETYQQRSDAGAAAYEADPENRDLARGPRFRLDAEVLRDQALYV
ncbi:MAG: PSD1 and planctomycete cytochrome C domain-containing protein, partial [Verrucomicrobiota bacterium]